MTHATSAGAPPSKLAGVNGTIFAPKPAKFEFARPLRARRQLATGRAFEIVGDAQRKLA